MRVLRILTATALLAAPLIAHAEPRDDARRAFVRALQAAEEGDFTRALDAFLEAQRLYPHPATMYNVARAYEDLGDPAQAVDWYEQLLRDFPDKAGDAEARAAALRRRLDRAAPAPVVTAPVAPAPTVVAPAATGATPEELARLQALARELDALTTELLERPPPVAAVAPAPVATPADPAPQDSDAPPATPDATAAAPDVTADDDTLASGGFAVEAYERTITSATRAAQSPLDSPSSITVITSDDIRLSGATTIADVLRRVPGVEVMSMSAATPYLGIRGFNSELSNKVLWLIDGRSVYFELLAAPLPFGLPIGLEDIERIEVIRGPGSALYGANAVTGVINIITKKADSAERAHIVVQGGSPAFLTASAGANGLVGDLGYRFSAGYQQEGRWSKDGAFTDDDPVEPFLENQDLSGRTVRGMGRLDYRFLDKGLASVEGGFTRGFAELYNIGALGGYAIDGQTYYARGDLSYGPVHLRGFWNHEEGDLGPWLSTPGRSRDLNATVNDDAVDLELEATLPFTTGPVSHQVNVGAGYRYKVFRFDYLQGGFETPFIEHHFRGFVQEQLSWKWFSATLSFRVDRHPLVDVSQTLSPRGALVFRVAPNTSLRVNAGTAFRAMNAVESYMDIAIDTPADGFFVRDFGGETAPGAPGLLPERIVTVEVGAHDESSVFHQLDVAVYWNRVTRLIGLVPVTAVLSPFDAERRGFPFGVSGWSNSDEIYDGFGGEAAVDIFPVTGLDIFANVAIQQILERGATETVVDGSTSLAKVNLGASYRAPFRMDFSFAGHFYSGQTWRQREFTDSGSIEIVEGNVPARFLMSLRVAGRPLPDRDLELALSLWNPLGFAPTTRFREHPKGQLVGPRLFGTVAFRF